MRRAYQLVLTGGCLLAAIITYDCALAQTSPATELLASRKRRLEKEQIKGSNIRSAATWSYTVGSTGELQEGVKKSHRRFDREGHLLEQITYNTDGTVQQHLSIASDGAGHPLRSVNWMAGSVGSIVTEYRYDNNDRLIEILSSREDGSLVTKVENRYGDDGKLAEMITDAPDTILDSRTVLRYDDGNITEATTYGLAGNDALRTTITYDSRGNPLEQTSYGPSGAHTTKTIISYNEDGNPIEVAVLNSEDKTVSRIRNIYDAEGKVIESVTELPGADTMSRMTFKYDGAGNKTEINTYNKLNQLVSKTRYTYEYYEQETEQAPKKEE